ncbi:MAG TPA: hypothetical protein VF411_06915, partial [Bacteroidia bacterium]
TIFTHIYNIALKTSLLCLIFIFGNLNKCSVLKHEGFVERHGSSVLKHEGFVERHGSSVLKHEDFVERHRSSAETNKHLFYKNKSPP